MTHKWRPGAQNRLILASFQVQLSAGLEEISITDYPAALASVFQEWPPFIIERSNLCCAFATIWNQHIAFMVPRSGSHCSLRWFSIWRFLRTSIPSDRLPSRPSSSVSWLGLLVIGYVCPEGNNANSSYCFSEVHSSAKVRQTLTEAVFVSSTFMTRMVQWWVPRFRSQARSEDLLREVKCPVKPSRWWWLQDACSRISMVKLACCPVYQACKMIDVTNLLRSRLHRYTVTGFQETHLAVFTATWPWH